MDGRTYRLTDGVDATVFRILCPPIHATVFRRLLVSSDTADDLASCKLDVNCGLPSGRPPARFLADPLWGLPSGRDTK